MQSFPIASWLMHTSR